MESHTSSMPCPIAQKQLHFFSIPSGRGNTLLDYDLHPRFIHDRAKKKVVLETGVTPGRNIVLNDSETYEIIPAILNQPDPKGVKDQNGDAALRPVAIYPGTRESLIEDCLIYFARNGEFSLERGEPGYIYDAGTLGVCFTLYQLRKALKELGKEYRLDELREGLEVLKLANYRYINDAERNRIRGYIVAELDSMPNKNPNDRIRTDHIMYVVFDSRASKKILSGHYRSYDDKCAMSMKSPIARYLYKQFTHNWQHANLKNEAGSIRSVDQNETILSSGCPLPSNPTKRKKNMLTALNELAKNGIIQDVDESCDVVKIPHGRKIVDLRFMVRPTNKFISQQIEGYRRLQASKKVGQEWEKNVNHTPMIGG